MVHPIIHFNSRKIVQHRIACELQKRAFCHCKFLSGFDLNELIVNDQIRVPAPDLNLLTALADSIAGDTELFKEMLTKAETERAELIGLIAVQEARVKAALKPISAAEAKVASTKLKQLITGAPADLKKRYIRAFVSDIVVGKSEIVISGSKDALAEAISGEPLEHLAAATGPVRSFEREWCAGMPTLRTYYGKHFLIGMKY